MSNEDPFALPVVDLDFLQFQRQFMTKLEDRSLDLSKPEDRLLYQPLHDERHDPVTRLFSTIQAKQQSVQILAGYRGTGKSTEFSRLAFLLRKAKYAVAMVNLDNYVNMQEPVDVVSLLLLLTGAIVNDLEKQKILAGNSLREDFWKRIVNFLQQDVHITKIGLGLDALKLEAELRGSHSVRQQIRQAMGDRLQALVAEVHKFHKEMLEKLKEKLGDATRLVIIADSLEHLRGVGTRAAEIHASVRDLFYVTGQYLQLPQTHMVFSVPAFLALNPDNLAAIFVNGQVQAWTSCRVRQRNGDVNQPCVDRLIQLVEKRGDWSKILPDKEALQEIILASGGYLRDLFNMLIEAVNLASQGVAPDAAREVIKTQARTYLPLYREVRELLQNIAAARDLRNVSDKDHERLLGCLDAHSVLCYLNSEFWYDVHPLIRPEL